MQLTRHTDYALRLLIYLSGIGDRRASIAEVAQTQEISQSHLMKIANNLAHAGFIDAARGRGGGIRLKGTPQDINLGAVIKALEPHCKLIDCTDCRLVRKCKLPPVLDNALQAFMNVLQEKTLADIVRQ